MGRHPSQIAVYLMIGMLILFSFVMANIILLSVTDSTIEQTNLRGQPQILQEELDVARSVEVADGANISLENEEAESKSSAPTESPTFEVAAAAKATTTDTTTTASSSWKHTRTLVRDCERREKI